MLDSITVFNPSYSTNESDSDKQLLLYHSFQGEQSYSLNEKLSQIGIIQAVWSFSQSFGDFKGVHQNVVELDQQIICTVLVEDDFFVSLAITAEHTSIPASYVFSHLRHCYDFFVLQFGLWRDFHDRRALTDRLNEVLVSYWSELNLMPQYLQFKGFLSLWPQAYKVAELPGLEDSSEPSWESDLKQQILLDETSFLGLKDVLVYNLPKPTSRKGYKSYGLVRNFAPNCDSLPQVSNWIEHMDTIYTRLSSHVIAGNVQYKENPEDEEPAENNTEHTTAGESLRSHSRKLYHNVTLPISFAYDAVQEVGNMAGISSSVSLLTDFMPNISSWNPWGSSAKKEKKARSEFLISPLSASFLPDSYKVKKLRLSFDQNAKEYSCLFWFYNEILVILVFEQDFMKIWEHEFLSDLHFKLQSCISKLSSEHLNTVPHDAEKFCYAVVSKKTSQIKSSFPLYKAPKVSETASPLELVVNGLDEFLNSGANRKTSVSTISANDVQLADEERSARQSWGLGLMGGFFKKEQSGKTPQVQVDTFLDCIPEEKLRDLHLDVTTFVNTLSTSKRADDLKEEKLIKLNNGVLCFIREDSEEIVVLAENWFNKKASKSKASTPSRGGLVEYMGKEASEWWSNRTHS